MSTLKLYVIIMPSIAPFINIKQHYIEYLNLITEMNFNKNIPTDEDDFVFVKIPGINSHVVATLIERRNDVTHT